MMDFDKLFETTPEEKFIDVIQHSPRGAVENTLINHCKEFIAIKLLLEQNSVKQDDIDKFIFENDHLLNENLNDIFIDLTAKILGHEG